MTTARKGRRPEPLAAQLLRQREGRAIGHRWPSPRWRQDPVAFAREVLNVEYLTDEQQAILHDLAQPRARVAVSSGHKTGKDYLGGIAALWWYASWDDARTRITAVTGNQIKDVCWREVTYHHGQSQVFSRHGRSHRGAFPVDGRVSLLPSSGIVTGMREVKGFTCEVPEAVAGVSSPHVLYIVTEASGVPDYVFEALKGNMAGEDCRLLLLSQPTRNLGEFFDAFHTKAGLWKRYTLRSDRGPNVAHGRIMVPGMATWDWLEEQAKDWGAPPRWREIAKGAPITSEDRAAAGPIWKIRIWGEFCEGEEASVIPASLVHEAEQRWAEMPVPRERLVVGLDVAKQGGDENVAAPRRGRKILELDAWVNSAHLPEEALAGEVARRAMEVVRRHRPPTAAELKAVVVVDSTGGFGIRVAGALQKYAAEIDVVPVNFGAYSVHRRKFRYLRDQLWFGFAEFLKEGGALPPDAKLPAELTAPGFDHDLLGRMQVDQKDKLRKKLGRSTDRADACLLAAYEARSVQLVAVDEAAEPAGAETLDPYESVGSLDPYAGLDAWSGR